MFVFIFRPVQRIGLLVSLLRACWEISLGENNLLKNISENWGMLLAFQGFTNLTSMFLAHLVRQACSKTYRQNRKSLRISSQNDQ